MHVNVNNVCLCECVKQHHTLKIQFNEIKQKLIPYFKDAQIVICGKKKQKQTTKIVPNCFYMALKGTREKKYIFK